MNGMFMLSANSYGVSVCHSLLASSALVSAHLSYSVLHDPLVGHIALVANQQLVNALGGIAVNLLEPLLDVVEAVHVGDIVDDANTLSTAVV